MGRYWSTRRAGNAVPPSSPGISNVRIRSTVVLTDPFVDWDYSPTLEGGGTVRLYNVVEGEGTLIFEQAVANIADMAFQFLEIAFTNFQTWMASVTPEATGVEVYGPQQFMDDGS